MSMLRLMEESLPPGFRFYPRDEELVCDYLEKKISSSSSSSYNVTINGNSGDSSAHMLIDVDLNKCEPWDLPEMACVGGKEWYFFNLHDRKYSTGLRTNRATQSGYWKATGKDRSVVRKQAVVGMRKTLVFYEGRAPAGKRTDWVMHEFRLEAKDDSSNLSNKMQEDWVLCRVSFKSRSRAPPKQLPAMMMTEAANHFHNNGSGSSHPPPPLLHTYINFDHPHGAEHDVSCSFSNNPLVIMPTATVSHQHVPPPPADGHLSWRPTWARS